MIVRRAIATTALLGSAMASQAQISTQTLDVRAVMVEGINPAALEIWDVGNNAMDDTGQIDPALMDDAKWARVHEAAQILSDYSRRMAGAAEIRASGPDLVGGEVPEGVASKEEIQAMIDRDPAGFRALSGQLAEEAESISAAAEAQDTAALSDLVLTFDGACQSCHERYWYPQQ